MLSAMQKVASLDDAATLGLIWSCPCCAGSLEAEPDTSGLICRACQFRLSEEAGIWRALPPERQKYFSRFISDYERIRAAEGRGSETSEYYLALPDRDLSGRNQLQWAIRARTYRYLVKTILPQIREVAGRAPRVLDIGAGNGWLSYRLASVGFRPVAVDLLLNDHDGLGSAKHYRNHLHTMFPCVQAENTRLPFASGQFDAVIFSASFHYSEDYSLTVLEAMRCLKAGGILIVADSPWYPKEASGIQMMKERRALFLNRFGTPSDSIHSQEFLTDKRLQDLEHQFGFRWNWYTPFYGLRWSMRPWIARLRRRREPARFRIYTGRKSA